MRKVWALGAVLFLLLAACGGGSSEQLTEGELFDGSDTTPPPGAIPTTVPGDGAPAAVGGDAAPPPAGPSGTVRPRPGGGSTGGSGGGTAGGGVAPPTVDRRRAQGPPGSFAAALLREDLTVEVLTQSGAQASGGAYAHLIAQLSAAAGRSVDTSGPIQLDGGAQDWTADDLRAMADSKAVRPAGSATIRMLFLHGAFEGRRGVLGVAVRGDVLAIFIDSVRSTGGLVGDASGVERAVMLHEAGHVLGLVDLFLDTGRADPDHPGHSPNKESVMYWAVETDAIASVFGANPPDTFDAADRADLARIKSGG